MFGRKAISLIGEMDSSSKLKPFNEVVVDEVIKEMQKLFAQNMTDSDTIRMNNKKELVPLVQVRHLALNRNKRCVLAYVYNRMRKLREMRWELGSILPSEINDNLLDKEVEWLQTYNKSLSTYMKSFGRKGLNLTKNILPPKTPYIEVKCLADVGKLEIEDGQLIWLKKNTYHLLPRSTCIPLIRQGILEPNNA